MATDKNLLILCTYFVFVFGIWQNEVISVSAAPDG